MYKIELRSNMIQESIHIFATDFKEVSFNKRIITFLYVETF